MNSRFLIIFVALGVGLLFMLAITISVFNTKQTLQKSPAPEPKTPFTQGLPIVIPNYDVSKQPTLSGYSEIIIGETGSESIAKLPGLLGTKTLPNGNMQFEFTSTDALRNNLVETEKDKAIFKSVVSITAGDYKAPDVTTYTQAYGAAEFEFTGSNRYGSYFITYVYPSRGFALIFNPYTFEVYEIQSFKPVSLEEYRNRWGQDINENLKKEQGDKI